MELKRLATLLEAGGPVMCFTVKEVKGYGKPFCRWFRNEMPGTEASKKSGVYFITDVEGNILYIGKASKNNLGAEIWGKFGAATNLNPGDIPYFGNSPLAQWAPSEYQESIRQGEIDIRAVQIEPQEFSSLAEVYLHVLCDRTDRWPVLNKRIG